MKKAPNTAVHPANYLAYIRQPDGQVRHMRLCYVHMGEHVSNGTFAVRDAVNLDVLGGTWECEDCARDA